MKYFVIFLIVIGLTGMIVPNAFASENQLPENMYSSAFGILEYKSVSGGPCTFMIPNYSTKSVNPADSSLLDLDAFHHSYFAVIGNHKDASYQYLQVGLPPGSGDPSYLIDLKNQKGDVMHGGMYADYKNLAVLTQTASSSSYLNENDYKRFFEEDTKDVTFSLHSLGPGNYSFDAILFKSQGSPWTKKESCVMHVEWPFEVTEKGDAVTKEPLITIGKLIDVTEIFPPLKQSKFGLVPESIRCKTGLEIVMQQSDGPGSSRTACISSDTKSKLIERGWTNNPTNTVQARDSLSNLEDATSSYMDRIIPNLDDFKNVLSGPHDIDEIFSKFGEPHDDIGGGIHIYVYDLNDKTQIWIGYADDIWYIHHVDSKGNMMEELFRKPPESLINVPSIKK